MKIYLLNMLLVLLTVTITFAQVNTTVTGYKVKRAKIQILPNGSDYFSSEPSDFGVTITGSATVIARAVWSFDVPSSIPSGSDVFKVEFIYSKSGSNTFNMGYVSSISSSPSYSEAWNAVENMSVFSNTGSGTSGTRDITGDIEDVVQQAVNSSNKRINLGFKSNTESVNIAANEFSSLQLKIYYYRAISFSVKNNFNDGQISVNGGNVDSGNTVNTVETNTVNLGAVEPQTSSGATYRWNDTEGTSNKSNWERIQGSKIDDMGQTQTITPTMVYDADNGSQYVANLRQSYSLTFQGANTIYINSVGKSSPTTEAVIEQNVINAAAGDYISNGIFYQFSNWTYSGGTATSTITPSASVTYTAQYTARAIPPTISFGTTIGQPVVINWTDNTNSNVTQYRIYRRIYQNGVWSTDAVIATVNSGVESYTDYDFNLGVWQQDILLEYGITAYYSVNSTWSQGGANTRVYCTIGASMQSNDLALAKTESEIPAGYSISSYPNPFNPATTINYQLPKDGMVTIKVYDIIGKEVATLVNEQKSVGYYKVDFNASKLTSGVYICSIQASSFNKSIKLILTK